MENLKSTTLWDLEYEYDPAFWENYNLLLDHPLNPEYEKDLEFEIPLEEQFKQETNVKIGNLRHTGNTSLGIIYRGFSILFYRAFHVQPLCLEH